MIFQLAEAGRVTVRIFNVAGRLVRTLEERVHPAGASEVTWDGTSDSRRRVAAGVYLAALDSGRTRATTKLVVVR